MRRLLCILLLLPFFAHAQIERPNRMDIDSVTFTFMPGGTLFKHVDGLLQPANVVIDTSGGEPWQVGSTLKPVFSNTVTPATGIMTNLAGPYPKNANGWFVLKLLPTVPNFIIDIWHEYLTDSTHAGGILEFSYDSGATWLNIAGCSYFDTAGMYTAAQTLTSGDAAFTGNSHGQKLTQIQVLNCAGVRRTATTCMPAGAPASIGFYLRFRFLSDTTTDSLPGWKIDSIRVENPGCQSGAVTQVNMPEVIQLYPNPATEQLTITSTAAITSAEIANVVGQTVYRKEGMNSDHVEINISGLAAGVYFAKINGSLVRKFVKE